MVTPADATVELDGLVVRDRSLRLPRGGSYKVTISAPGFQPHTRDLGVVADGELRVTLLPELAAVPPPSDRPHRVPRPGKSPGPSASPASTAPASPSPSPAKLPIKGPVVKTL